MPVQVMLCCQLGSSQVGFCHQVSYKIAFNSQMPVDLGVLLRHCSSVLPPKILPGAISIPISQMRKLGLREGQNLPNASQPMSMIPAAH